MDDDGYDRLGMDDFGDNKHDGLQLMNLLYAIAEDQAVKEGHIHRGITCNHCRIVPIRGLRYKCANCQDYDLCEGCEALEVHIKSHVFMKIRIPIPPLANSRNKKLPSFYPGIPQGNTSTPDHLLQELLQKTHFDNVELDAMYSQYLSLSTLDQDGGGITRLTFEQALGPLGLEKNLITDRIFRFFDQDNDSIINFKEMACGLSVLCKGNFDEKIDFAFQGYDIDEDGYISREELHEMFKAYFYLSMELIRDVVKTMENDLISNFEYQPGMPISSTFTAPIPREIGVRNNNGQNDNNNNANGNRTAQDRRRNREQAPLPAEWTLPVIPSDESSRSTTPLSSPSIHGAAGDEFDDVIIEGPVDRRALDEPRESVLPSSWYRPTDPDAAIDSQGIDDEDTNDAESVQEVDNGETGASAVVDDIAEKNQDTGSELLEPQELGSRRHASDSEESEADNLEEGSSSSPPIAQPAGEDSTSDQPANGTIEEADDGLLAAPRTVAVDSPETSSEDEGSSSSWNRPRKDQPLPSTTSPPHLAAPSLSNTNFAWERPHHRAGSSGSYYNASSATPSLAPALAIGFGLPHGATSPSSFSSSPSSSSSTQNRHISRGSRTADVNDHRRPSLGGPFHSFGASSSAPAGSYANSSYFSGTFPVMESISQDAIQEMVDKTFNAIKNPSKPGYITLEEFRAYVLTDSGILGWFEALGSIF